MKTNQWPLFSCLVILSLLLAPTSLALGQAVPPPSAGPAEKPGGSRGPAAHHPLDARLAGKPLDNAPEIGVGGMAVEAAADLGAQAFSGYGFGYTRKAAPFNWVDASSGTVVDFGSGPAQSIDLPFPFPFYENTYEAVNLVQYGYLTFSSHASVYSNTQLLKPNQPNDIIAPYWAPVNLSDHGAVYVLSGGVEPERYVVFAWLDVHDDASTENHFTFQVVLHENGNILFQYGAFEYLSLWYYASAGIEDSSGTIGQVSLPYKTRQKSNRAVLFTRPTNSAGVKIFPDRYGAFAASGGPASYTVEVINSGTLDEDVYDLRFASRWPAIAYQADGVTPLVDTDGDGKIDTGPVPVGGSVTVIIKVTAPPTAKVGNTRATTVTFTSSLKTTRNKTITLTSTIPAAFTQVTTVNALDQTAAILQTDVSPAGGSISTEIAADTRAMNPGVARLPSGNLVLVWSEYGCADACEQVIYTIRSASGEVIVPPTVLEVGQPGRWDFGAVPAVAPNGSTGLAFLRQEQQQDGDLYNVYFALLDASGSPVGAPVNVTKNTSTPIQYYDPRIEAAADSNFFIAYQRDTTTAATADIYLAKFSGSTAEPHSPAQAITGAVGYQSGYYCPSLARLTGDRLLVAYHGYKTKGLSWTEYVFYTVLAADGSVVKPQTGIALGKVNSYGVDSVQMTGGQILLAWGVYKNNRESIAYAVLKDATYARVKGPATLTIKAALTGSYYASVTRDHEGRGIITWADDWRDFGRHTYYSLVGANGGLLTPPVIFNTSPNDHYLYLTPYGSGNATSAP